MCCLQLPGTCAVQLPTCGRSRQQLSMNLSHTCTELSPHLHFSKCKMKFFKSANKFLNSLPLHSDLKISQSETVAEGFKKARQWNVQAHIAKSSSSSCSQCFEASTSWQASVSTQETRKLQVLSRCFYTPYTVRVRIVQRVVTLPFFFHKVCCALGCLKWIKQERGSFSCNAETLACFIVFPSLLASI